MPNSITPLTSVQALPMGGGNTGGPFTHLTFDRNDFTAQGKLEMLHFPYLESGWFEARIKVDLVFRQAQTDLRLLVGFTTRSQDQVLFTVPGVYGNSPGYQDGFNYLIDGAPSATFDYNRTINFAYHVLGSDDSTYLHFQVSGVTSPVPNSGSVDLYYRKTPFATIPPIPSKPPLDKIKQLEARLDALEARF